MRNNMNNEKAIDLTKGNIFYLLLTFTIPILLAALFQQLYNTVDTMIVSHYLGANALAALGATTALYDLIIGFSTGVGSGFSIVVAKHYGAKNKTMVKRSVAGSIVLSLCLSLLIMLFTLFLLHPILELLHTPKTIIADAYSYIFPIGIFVFVTITYNLSAALLRAIGNSFTPLIVLLIASVLNIIFDLLFVAIFSFGILGAAIATIIAQAIAAVICLFYIIRKCHLLVPDHSDFTSDPSLYQELLSQGFSMGFMLSIVSIGTLLLQTSINRFGTNIIAGHTAARKLSALFSLPLSTLGTAMATFTSQNKGAGRIARIRKGVKDAMILSTIWCIITLFLNYFFSPFLTQLICGNGDFEVITTALLYLNTNVPFYFAVGPLLILRCALQGMGEKFLPLVSSFIEMFGKMIFVLIFIPIFHYLGVCFSEPVIWILMFLQLSYSFYHNQEIKEAKTIVLKDRKSPNKNR